MSHLYIFLLIYFGDFFPEHIDLHFLITALLFLALDKEAPLYPWLKFVGRGHQYFEAPKTSKNIIRKRREKNESESQKKR